MSHGRLSGTAPLILFLVGALASIGLVLLYAYAPDVRNGQSSDSVAISPSAIGYAGLQALMRHAGIAVELDRGQAAGAVPPSQTIVTPTIRTPTGELRAYRARGPLLVILPKWITVPIPLRSGRVYKAGAWNTGALERLVQPYAALEIAQKPGDTHNPALRAQPAMAGLPGNLNVRMEQVQTISQGAEVLLDLGDSRRAVLVRVRGAANPVYVLSEPDLMNNQGLANESVAHAALAIIGALRRGNGPVMLDVTLNGLGRSPSMLKALFEPPFRGATICAVLAALLMAFHTLARFGAPQDAAPAAARGKRALADNTAELVRIMGRESGMALRYVQAAREFALARLGARGRKGSEQDALLAAMEKSGGSATRYDDLVTEAAAARSSGDLMRIATRTHAWRRSVTGEHP
jgi:hypothetical protein